MCKLCWSAAVYHLWGQQNDIRHGKSPRAEEKLLKDVIWEVEEKFRKNDINVKIYIDWDIFLDILY